MIWLRWKLTQLTCRVFGHKATKHSILGLYCTRCLEILGHFEPRYWGIGA